MELDKNRIVIDPGPGSLVRAIQYKLDPGSLDAVLCSHKHLDHYNDVEVMIEAMTHGLRRDKGKVVLQEAVLEYISEYHRGSINSQIVKKGDMIDVNGLGIECIPTAKHVDAVGFKFHTSGGIVTYSSDTAYDKKVVSHYKDSKILILNTIFPSGRQPETHLCTDDAVKIASEVKPELLVLTHFGVRMLNKDPVIEAKRIIEETDINTIAADDGMRINVDSLDH